jgi:glycosyltransferase involved in cell wall biosynthesis
VRVLVVSPYVPWPAHSGGHVRTWQLSQRLARRHEVHLFCLRSPREPPVGHAGPYGVFASVATADIPRLNPRRGSVAWALLRARSLRTPAAQYVRRRAGESLAATARTVRPDAVLLEHSWLLPYARRMVPTAVVVDEHDFEPLRTEREACARTGWRRWLWRTYARTTLLAERRGLSHVQGIAAVSDLEADRLSILAPHACVRVVPNGVDMAAFRRLPLGQGVVMIGTMTYRPNRDGAVWFARHVWPLVRTAIPQATVRLVGPGAHRELAGLAALPGVEVVGPVDRVAVELASAAIAVAPLQTGAGTRLKVLEALAAGRPVVATRVAVEGLDVHDGRHVRLADEPEPFAAALVELLSDRALAERMGLAGREHVARHYDWDTSASALEQLLRLVTAG